jgi:predicted dehydrogenase
MGASAGLRVAVVGAGHWAHRHLRVLAGVPGVTAVAAADPRRPVHSGHGDAPPLGDVLPLVDAVVVATSPTTHAALTLAALAAGKHVLVEQPLATTTADALTLVDAADEAGRVLMVGGAVGHDPVVAALGELVRGGDLGPVHLLAGERHALGLHAGDVDVLTDLAPREIWAADAVLGSRATSVAAWAAEPARPPHTDVAHLRLDYADIGATTTLHLSRAQPRSVRRAVALGALATAVADERGLRVLAPSAARAEQQVVQVTDALAAQAREFVGHVTDGTRPEADGRHGAGLVRVLDAARRSLREGGRRVPVDEIALVPPAVPVTPVAIGVTEPAR